MTRVGLPAPLDRTWAVRMAKREHGLPAPFREELALGRISSYAPMQPKGKMCVILFFDGHNKKYLIQYIKKEDATFQNS